MVPKAEIAHWLAASVALLLGLILLAQVIVGPEVFARRRWRAYLWPFVALVAGIGLWVIAIFSTFSTMHLVAHSVWAESAMIAGGVQLAVVRGKLSSPYWWLVTAAALFFSGVTFLVHEQNGWLFSRSAFLHHTIGWSLIVAALFPVGAALRPGSRVWSTGFALTFVVLAVMLYSDRDSAPIFGHFEGVVIRR
jgi:hypothetical protein